MRKLLVPVLVIVARRPAAAPALAATKRVKVGDNYFVRDGGVPDGHRGQEHARQVGLDGQEPRTT